MVTLLLWFVSGMLVGCFANALIASYTDKKQPGEAQNVLMGAIGAALGGAVYARQMTSDALSIVGMLTAFGGAILLILLSKISRELVA